MLCLGININSITVIDFSHKVVTNSYVTSNGDFYVTSSQDFYITT